MARGRYLASLAHCVQCHSPQLPNGAIDTTRLGAGGRVFVTASGAAVSHNLTRDKDLGLGNWSDARIISALTSGVSADGRTLAPAMRARAAAFARWTAADMADLIAWLRSLPAKE